MKGINVSMIPDLLANAVRFFAWLNQTAASLTQFFLLWLLSPLSPRHGYKLLHPSSRDNHRHSPQKPEWLKHEIIRLKALMPQAGCRSIANICNRRFAASRKVTVGKTYVHQILQQHDYEIQILDHGSRALLYLHALHNKTSRTLLACLLEVIRTHGKPKIIRTDNEAIFTSKKFRRGLKLLGIRHQRTDPGCPWQNGRIERFFGTLKQKLDQLTYSPLPQAGEGLGVREQLNRDLDTFRHWYNHIRSHQNLNGKTPAEVWSGSNPYIKPPKQEYWFKAWDGLLAGYLRY